MSLVIIMTIIVFILGFYMCSTYGSNDVRESFINKPRCPNVLIQHGAELYLYNSKLAKVPGVNPIKFNNLEEYTEFMDWQRSQGINCPVLFLQHSYDAQDMSQYSIRPDPFDPKGGLPDSIVTGRRDPPVQKMFDAGRNDPPYNVSDYPAYDPENQYVGIKVPLDDMKTPTGSDGLSDNPMDTNWGGPGHAQESVKSGTYDDDKVIVKTK